MAASSELELAPTLEQAPARLARITTLRAHEALTELARIQRAVPHCGTPEQRAALVAALPRHQASLAPEIARALAELAGALLPHSPAAPEDLDQLPGPARLAWQRVATCVDPEASSPEQLSEIDLLRVLADGSMSEAADPFRLAQRICQAQDERLRASLPGRLLDAVCDLAMSPPQAFVCLVELASDPHREIRLRAYTSLAELWLHPLSATDTETRERLVRAGLDDPDHEVAAICVEMSARLGARAWLVDLLDDEQRELHTRLAALEALGALAQAEDLEVALTLAVHDPLRFGQAARTFMLDAHRHGVFLDDSQIELALEAFDHHTGWTAEELVRVTYIARKALLDALGRLRADDPRWRRRAALLALSLDQGAASLLAELLVEAHTREADPLTAAALIAAAGASPNYTHEEPLLTWIDRLPEQVIPILRIKGGAASIETLRSLALAPDSPEPVRRSALITLWALSPDRVTLWQELARALGPHTGGLLDTRFRATRDTLAATIYTQAAWPDDPRHHLDPSDALELLCESGDKAHLAQVTLLFRRLYTRLVQAAVDGDFHIKREQLPALEQRIYHYGRLLIANGRPVRRFMSEAPETGRDLLLALASDWLAERPEAPVRVALLETLGRQLPTGMHLRQIQAAWRDPKPNVQRAAMETLVGAGEDARGLELSLCRLGESTDARILQRAMMAVASLGARWAEPMVIAALQHPNMNVKLEAATALKAIGTAACVPSLLTWLGHHDNDSLRRRLLDALDEVTRGAAAAVLVHALEAPLQHPDPDPDRSQSGRAQRRQGLLRAAISGRLSLAAAMRLAVSTQREHIELLDAAVEGTVQLRDATTQQLADALYRAKHRPADPTLDLGQRLRLEGFSPAAALELIAALNQDGVGYSLRRGALAALRSIHPQWLRWLREQPEASSITTAALALAFEAADDSHHELLDPLLALAESNPTALALPELPAFITRCIRVTSTLDRRMRAIELLRARAPAAHLRGPRCYKLLRTLGAVLCRQDLDRCLAACRLGPAIVADSMELLCTALKLPNQLTAAEARAKPQLEQLHQQLARWPALDPDSARTWLDEVLQTRPLGLSLLPEALESGAARPAAPDPEVLMQRLLARVHGEDPRARDRAAATLLAWPDARQTWPTLQRLHLDGRLLLPRASVQALAAGLEQWPSDNLASPEAIALVSHLSRTQLRGFLPVWIEAWLQGTREAEALLNKVDQTLLFPHALAQARRGHYGLVDLLVADNSLALAHLVEQLAVDAPERVAHLRPDPEPEPEPDDAQLVILDPIAELDLHGLLELIEADADALGLAVRAVHALTRYEARGADALEGLTLDARPRIRSAALRALRKVCPRERSLDASARVLQIETRRDVICSLISSLGYGRHLPSAPALLEYTLHRDRRIQASASEVLRAWGHDVLPTLRRVAGRARPDRRRRYEALLDSF